MNKIKQILGLGLTVACAACSTEAPMIDDNSQTGQTENKCRMILDAEKPTFESSRADGSQWQDGDIVYLQFIKADKSEVYGTATYNATDKGWELTYSGILPSTTDADCYAYYMEGDCSVNDGVVVMSPATCFYSDRGTYSKTSSGVMVSARLDPLNGRVRFTGTSGQKFTVSGLRMYEQFDPNGCLLTICDSYTTSIGRDGSSEYIYMNKGNHGDPILVVSYDKLSFSMYCDSPILDYGESGYLSLPTRNSHAGWSMQEITAPKVGATTVSEVSANSAAFESSIISDGNSPITECGFVYSTKENPTVSDSKVIGSTTTLRATATGLSKNTTYYVRAFATNSEGTQYGTQASFTTKSGVVEVSNGLSALYLFEGNFDDSSENAYDGFGISDPTFVAGVNGGKAVKFTKDSYMRVGSVLNQTNAHSTAFWIKDPSDGSIYATPTSGKSYPGPEQSLELENGKLRYFVDSYYNTYEYNRSDRGLFNHPSLTDGNWHHIVLVCQHSDNMSTTTLYFDGKKADVVTESRGWSKTGISFQLGGTIKHDSSYIHTGAPMTIDNFRAYTRCLTAEEVKTIYNSEKP